MSHDDECRYLNYAFGYDARFAITNSPHTDVDCFVYVPEKGRLIYIGLPHVIA